MQNLWFQVDAVRISLSFDKFIVTESTGLHVSNPFSNTASAVLS